VLVADGLYVLQLRDNKPDIAAPGVWALFGGRVEAHESAHDALIREVEEELCVRIERCHELWVVDRYSEFSRAMGTYSFFHADITPAWPGHRLMEGQAVDRFTYEQSLTLPMFPIMQQALALHHEGLDTRK
jgi:8-oxo-dGTP diphosphatase